MFKEAGNLAKAEAHYLEALRLTPDDPDLALQLGHFYKVGGRLKESAASYRRAAELSPRWRAPKEELASLRRAGWREHRDALRVEEVDPPDLQTPDFATEAAELNRPGQSDRLVPEIFPEDPERMFHPHHDSINLRRFGRRERSYWGMLPTFRGVEAIRGFCISSVPILDLQITLNGLLVHRGPVRGGYRLQYERDESIRKYVFNVWFDFSGFVRGRYELELRFLDANEGVRTHREQVVIDSPLTETEAPNSDGVITLSDAEVGSVDDRINARPSVVRPAKREVFAAPPRKVLILRTDQLGDMVTSIPAMRRLRELLPDSHFVGLLTSSNCDFAATLGLFDEIIPVDFPDDLFLRRRTMTLEAQEALREKLARYEFDLAIDLAYSSMSRPLLLLSGAKFLYGFYDREWPWLSAGFEGASHDPKNDKEVAAHSTMVLAFVERLGPMLKSRAEIIRRPDLSRDRLARFGISQTDRFAVLHTGARIAFSRWPYYPELAAMMLERTDLKVFLLTDDADLRDTLPSELQASERFQLIDQRLAFDDFDALLSFCDVFVGNDSGPKHLAALRGSNVISLHSARVNWNDWGQELSGSIISRKVPCAGCSIYHDADECGKDYVCIVNISPEEVFAQVSKSLSKPAPWLKDTGEMHAGDEPVASHGTMTLA